MSLDPTSICNLALARIGHRDGNPLLDYRTDNTKAGRLCRIMYPLNLEAMLREHTWNCAIRRATLARLSAAPTFEYLYAYQLPTDFVRLSYTAIDRNADDITYRIEGLTVVTDDDTFELEYVALISDTTQADALFVDALATRLAADLCMPITDNNSLTEKMWSAYAERLQRARNADAQEGTARGFYATDWERSRL
jgi:hypothetical protein